MSQRAPAVQYRSAFIEHSSPRPRSPPEPGPLQRQTLTVNLCSAIGRSRSSCH
jgi:hypothetical protein